MSNDRERIDWEAARRSLQDAEAALDKGLVADTERIERVYRERAIQMAQRHTVAATTVRRMSVLVFSLAAETYGIAISDLAEVLPAARCTPVPRAAAEIAGVINLRGELRSVIDLRRLLSVPAAAEESVSCILMLRNGREEVGLKVGQVDKVQAMREDELVPLEGSGSEGAASYVKGLSPEQVIVLDTTALRSHPIFRNSP